MSSADGIGGSAMPTPKPAGERGTVTLLYSAHDVLHNGALVLCEYLTEKGRPRSPKAGQTKVKSARLRTAKG